MKPYSFFSLVILLLAASPSISQNQKPAKPVVLDLQPGFKALTVVDDLGKNRHIAVDVNSDIYVKFGELKDGKGIMRLRDLDSDVKADSLEGFGHFKGTGIAIRGRYLYASSNDDIFRYRIKTNGEIENPETPEKVVGGLNNNGAHESKAFTFDKEGNIYVNIGAPSNSCQESDRMKGSPGKDPCPILDYAAGIWKFKGDVLNQKQTDGEKYATGIRNVVALDWDPNSNQLFAVQHGRDDLHRLFPHLFTEKQNSELPAEELLVVNKGDNFGWPYCYYDPIKQIRVTMPEYGGDGSKADRCKGFEDPVMAFPAHWSPNDLLFYTGTMFPEKYRGGAFIAFHGSWNRTPHQEGYHVVFVPMKNGKPSGPYEFFASGFPGGPIKNPADAMHRACGLAQGPDGALYISDSQKGKIWKITYGQ